MKMYILSQQEPIRTGDKTEWDYHAQEDVVGAKTYSMELAQAIERCRHMILSNKDPIALDSLKADIVSQLDIKPGRDGNDLIAFVMRFSERI